MPRRRKFLLARWNGTKYEIIRQLDVVDSRVMIQLRRSCDVTPKTLITTRFEHAEKFWRKKKRIRRTVIEIAPCAPTTPYNIFPWVFAFYVFWRFPLSPLLETVFLLNGVHPYLHIRSYAKTLPYQRDHYYIYIYIYLYISIYIFISIYIRAHLNEC